MQARRILLLFGILLLATAAAASFVPVPEETGQGDDDGAANETGAVDPPTEPLPDDAVDITFRAEDGSRAETVGTGSRVVLTAESEEPGQVELEGLGRTQTVGPGAPAVFDLFTDRAGRFDAVYTPVDGGEERLGTLIVEASGSAPQERATDRPDQSTEPRQ